MPNARQALFQRAVAIGPTVETTRARDMSSAIRAGLERRLDALLPMTQPGPPRLVEAMRYGLLAPAKRVRGILTGLVAQQFGVDPQKTETVAAAIEMVHAASLILDDLPCMDDADVRRGRPACHLIYGDDTATLAAVGLMNHAFLVVARDDALPVALRPRLLAEIAAAIGPDGLIGGQEQDLRGAGELDIVADVEVMHARKTGILFALAADVGAGIAGANAIQCAAMRSFGAKLGLAFQTYDDVLDAVATIESAGKDVGQDAAKTTVVSLLGVDAAKAHADQRIAEALADMQSAGGDTELVIAFVHALVEQLGARAARISGG